MNLRRIKNAAKRVLLGPAALTPPTPTYSREAYGQVGEDIVTNFLVGDKSEGFYVDVGAHHPQRYSNTYFFYQRGWRGINIDALPGSMALFQTLRPRDINLEMGISGARDTLTYYSFDEPAVNGFSRELSESRDGKFKLLGQTEIQTYPLSEILDQHLPPGQAIDFLSVDVEGLDYEVLQSNDWTRYRPNVVLIEDLAIITLADLHASPLTQLMKSYGYTPCSQCIHTLFYLEDGLVDRVMRD